MAWSTNGLPNGGLTTHYKVDYDASLSQADGQDRANALIGVLEADFAKMAGWFAGVPLKAVTPMTLHIAAGQGSNAAWIADTTETTVTLTPGNGSDLTLVRYLLVMEVTEIFMLSQNAKNGWRGWYGAGGIPPNEGSAGEGLSHYLADQLLIEDGLQPEQQFLGNFWMKSSRADYVNHVNFGDNQPDEVTGCAVLFIYYLHSQLGFTTEQIVAAADPELSGVYRNLAGPLVFPSPNLFPPSNSPLARAYDPFPDFKALLEYHFPGKTTIPGINSDNPFPLLWDIRYHPGPPSGVYPGKRVNGNWVSWDVEVETAGPTGSSPVAHWGPFTRQLAAGFALADIAQLVSPELRKSVNKLAAEQVQLASRQIAEHIVAEEPRTERVAERAVAARPPRLTAATVSTANQALDDGDGDGLEAES